MSGPLPLEVRFLRRFARRLHASGVPAHQLEAMLEAIGARLGLECAVWSSPTAIFMSFHWFDDVDDQRPIPLQLLRLDSPGVNLAHTTDLYALAEDVFEGRIEVDEAFRALRSAAPERFSPTAVWVLAWGVCAASVALMLNASWAGIATAGLVGTLMGLMALAAQRSERYGRSSFEALAALVATVLVHVINALVGGLDTNTIILASLIIIIPGLGLTIAVTELSTDHLASGAARLAGAVVTILKLALGVLLGTVLVQAAGLPAEAISVRHAAPPPWMLGPGLLAAAFSFAVLFSVRPKDFWLAMSAAVVSFVVSRLGANLGGVEVGVLLAALVVAAGGNLAAGWVNRPAALFRVPGIILLVPGSIGYRAATDAIVLGRQDPQTTMLVVLTVAISLVGGLLLGNAVVPPRRYL